MKNTFSLITCLLLIPLMLASQEHADDKEILQKLADNIISNTDYYFIDPITGDRIKDLNTENYHKKVLLPISWKTINS